jgi:hypothetical protein
VIFDRLDHAWRESFTSNGWPVEVFAHDPETLRYFFTEVDRPTGVASLAHMVLDGVEVPAVSELSISLKRLARDIVVQGPPHLSEQELAKLRYMITDLVDDIRSPRLVTELVAVGAKLYETLADGFLRTRDRWSARGKGIPRQLRKVDATFADRHQLAFETLFSQHDARPVISLAEEVLAPVGGWLFDGNRLDAPTRWRKAGPHAETEVPDER